ncbi:MAG: V-type ATPase subunit [Synergistaceae bacterium]|nr:V-type ATPase subunit [Synergistaceae bacterium]
MAGINRDHPSGYGYVVSRLRTMENRLIDDGVLQRIIDSEEIDGALKVLGETSYSAGISEMKSSADFDSLIESELLNCYKEVTSFVPDSDVVALCRLPYDFHNVKVLIKNLIQVKDGGERSYRLLSNLGSIPTDALILAIEGEDYKLLPHSLDLAIPKCLSVWEQTRELQEAERVLDEALFKVIRDKAEDLKMPHVSEWVRIKIDTENLRTLYRLKRLGTETAEALKFLHKGGNVSPERFVQVLSEPVEGWGRFLAASSLGGAFSSVQESTDIEGTIIDMERALDEFSVKALQSAKYDAFSPSNVLLYLCTKESEAKNLRIALVAVANGTDKDLARRLLRHAR